MAKGKTIALWILQLLLTLPMAGSGIEKFTKPAWARMFRTWGYPDHFYLVIGAVEVVGAAGLLIPKATSYAAGMLAVVMAGAAVTQITHGTRSGFGEVVLMLLLLVVAWGRRDRAARLRTRGAAASGTAAV